VLQHIDGAVTSRTVSDVDNASSVLRDLVHELNTPLAALAAALLLVQQDQTDADSLRSALLAQRHLASLVTRARALLPTDRPLQPTPTVLLDAISETAQMLQPLALEAGSEVKVNVNDVHVAMIDRHAFRQILVNIVANSFKYAQGSVVSITAGSDSTHIWVEVSDTGPGIPIEQWEKLLTAGHRLDRDLLLPGDGLGLAVTVQLLSSMGGRAELVPGPGTTIRLLLPRP